MCEKSKSTTFSYYKMLNSYDCCEDSVLSPKKRLFFGELPLGTIVSANLTNTEFYVPDHGSQAAIMAKFWAFMLNMDLFRTTFEAFQDFLLLETPCPLVTFFTPSACAMDQPLWISGRASTGAWVTRRAWRTLSNRPEGPQPRSRGPEGPQTSSYI